MDAVSIKNEVASILRECGPVDLFAPSGLFKNLSFLWHVIRGSEPLLRLAVVHSEGELHDYFVDHLAEEEGHETWLQEDLASAGFDVTRTVLPREAVELVGSQLYLVQFVDACALLGYMVVMECFPKSLDTVEALEDIYGSAVLRTLRYHAEHDTKHGDDVLEMINKLSDQRQLLVLESATQTARYLISAVQAFRVNT